VVATGSVISGAGGFLHVLIVHTITVQSRGVGLIFTDFVCTLENMKTTTKNRGGRPPKGSDKIKAFRLDLRLELAEKEGFRAAAELSGLDMSGWIRERLRQAARKELDQAGQPVPFIQSSQ
jgi:hypothetical protein